MRFPGFIGPAYLTQNPASTSEILLNLFPEKNESAGAKSPFDLLSVPGLTSFASALGGTCRRAFALDGRCWSVHGTTFREVFTDGTTTSRGTVAMGAQSCTFASSGDAGGEVAVTSGRNLYIFNLSTNVLSAAVKTGIDFCGYLDGYFLGLDATTSSLYISNLLDGTTWSIGAAQRDGAGDKWVSMLVTHQDIWLFGSETSEVWANLGLSPFPFALQSGAVIQQGTLAPSSVALLQNSPVWLSQSAQGAGIVLMAQGYGDPARISNYAIEQAIRGYTTISDAEAFTYEDSGHNFYVLTFPSEDVTWVYDAATDSWAQRGYLNAAAGTLEAYRPNCHVYAFGKHLVGDRDSSTLWELDPGSFTDVDGSGIKRQRRAPHLDRFVFDVSMSDPVPWRLSEAYVDIRQGFRRLTCDRFALDLQTGVGLTSGQGSDPQVMLSVSLDGGRTFGNELTRSAGAMGEYSTIVEWHRLGSVRTVG